MGTVKVYKEAKIRLLEEKGGEVGRIRKPPRFYFISAPIIGSHLKGWQTLGRPDG